MRRLSIACVMMLMAGASAAQVVECVDARGNKEYAHFCSPGTVKQTPVRSAPAASGSTSDAAAASPAPSFAEQEAAFRKRELERKEAEAKNAKEKADEDNVRKNCELALSNLRDLQDGQRIARYDPNTGERSVVDDDTRPAEIAAAQKTVDSWCKR